MEMIVVVGIIITLIIIGGIATLTYFFVNVWSNNKSTYTPESMKINIEITDISNKIFELPLTFTGDESVNVDWGDGNSNGNVKESISHTYEKLDNYSITITGKATQYGKSVSSYIGVDTVKNVISWGDLGLKSLAGAFRDASNLTSVPNNLPTTVTNLDYMFFNATTFNGDISGWNTSNITSMTSMFEGTISFNQPIGSWNTSKVTDMGGMFSENQVFNQNIESWNTVNVTNMGGMFYNNIMFDQNLSFWNVDNVTNARAIFYNCPMLSLVGKYPPFKSPLPSIPDDTYYGSLAR